MPGTCAVCGLTVRIAKRHRISVGFHLFPSEPVQRKAWEAFAEGGRGQTRGATICSAHFVDECFRGGTRNPGPDKRRVLRDGAVPTILEGVSLEARLRKKQKKRKIDDTVQQVTVPMELPLKLENVCRICDSEVELYDLSLEENFELAGKFSSLTSIELDRTAPWFCEHCLGRLRDAYDFVRQCNEAESKRKSLLFVSKLEVKTEVEDDGEEGSVSEPIEEEDEDTSSDDDDDGEVSEPEGPKIHTCETCQATFEKIKDLFAHYKSHGKKRFPCALCERSFPKKSYLAEHQFTHKASPSFFCPQCSASFRCRNSLQRHVKNIHLAIKAFACEICDQRFAQKTHLQAHGSVHVREAEVPCEMCEKMFKTGILLRAHINQVHGDKKRDKERKLEPFECDVCSKVFLSKQNLAIHKRSHEEPNELCNVCGKKFKTTTIKSHMLTHTSIQPYACDQCPKKFKSSKSLVYHRLAHAGLKPYQCDQCDRTFRARIQLKTHKDCKHAGLKPFECTICQKQCSRMANLRLHMKVHQGQKLADDDGGGGGEEGMF